MTASSISDRMPELSPLLVAKLVGMALEEDLGRAGDITSNAIIERDARAVAMVVSRQSGTIAGMGLLACAFHTMNADIRVDLNFRDGECIEPGRTLARIEGNARAMLAAERVGLNYLMHLSGIATLTAAYAREVEHTKALVCCTRKTLPGLRVLQKYAVRCGGGVNHRFGLDDAVLIKDNHIAIAGGVVPAVNAAKQNSGHLVKIEVEVDTIEQLEEALTAAPDVILLDNMSPQVLRQAVDVTAGRCILEASGNIDLDTIRVVAESGVDYISTSKITMAASTLDVGLDIEIG